MTPRDIEKLQAIGYSPVAFSRKNLYDVKTPIGMLVLDPAKGNGISDAWVAAKAHSQSDGGLKATMADKVRWLNGAHILCEVGSGEEPQAIAWFCERNGQQTEYHDSPEAAVDALFWKVP